MKKILSLLLIMMMMGIFVGCNNNGSNDLSHDFSVEGLSLNNEEIDGRSQYYSKINSIIRDIESHSLYPGIAYSDNHGELRNYFSNGVSKDNYELEDEKTLIYSNYSAFIAGIVQNIPNIEQGMDTTFYENSEISYYNSVFTTYANDDYIYYYSENNQNESSTFEVLVEDDNIKMTYLYESDNETRYLKNDFNQGFLLVRIRHASNSEFSYIYELYNYQTDQREVIEYNSYKNTLTVMLSDYKNDVILEYRKDIDTEYYKTTLLTDGYRDIYVIKHVLDDETSYIISYNIMNISGWDYFQKNTLYLNDNEVLSSYSPSMLFGFDSARVHQNLSDISQDNFNVIGESTYNGPISFNDIQTSLDTAENITDSYSITYTESNEVYTLVIDSTTYTLEELRVFFEGLIVDRDQNTTG